MRIYSIVLLLMMIGSHQSMAQSLRTINSDVYHGDYENLNRKLNYNDIKGSPYLSEDLVLGQVFFENKDSAEYYLRYDIYGDEIEYLQNKHLFAIINMATLDHIILNGQKIVYQTYYVDGKQTEGFLIELVKDKCSLYLKYHIEFEDAQPGQSMPFREATVDQFKPISEQWFFAHDTSPLTSFIPNSTGLKQVSGENYNELKAFVKANKLKTRKEDDLVALIEYYNVLLKQ